MRNYFEGYYFKLTTLEETVCFIVGYCLGEDSHSFIQVLGTGFPESYYFQFDTLQCTMMRQPLYIRINNNIFTKKRIQLDLEQEGVTIKGTVFFKESVSLVCTPYTPSIMGPLHYFQPKCIHELVSLYSKVNGTLTINHQPFVLNQAWGYIEGDRGESFPTSYLWLQAMEEDFSIFLAYALVPWQNISAKGVIAVIHMPKKQYRFASYYLAQVKMMQKNGKLFLKITQGKLTLFMSITADSDFTNLRSPTMGSMSSSVMESVNARISVILYKDGQRILVKSNLLTSLELENILPLMQ